MYTTFKCPNLRQRGWVLSGSAASPCSVKFAADVPRQADVDLGKGLAMPEICKQLGISEQTYDHWRNGHRRAALVGGRMDPLMAKQLEEFEQQNSQLRKLAADQTLGNQILEEATHPI